MPPSRTLPLFDDAPDAGPDEPAEPPRTLVAVLARTRPTDKSRLAFARLVEKIEAKREELGRWQAYLSRYQQRLAGELQPLQAKLRDGQRQMAVLLDELLTQPAPGKGRRLGKVQQAKLRQLLLNLVTGLLEEGEDAQLEAIHDRHSEVSHAQERQDDLELTQAMLQDVFGVDVGDDHGASTAEELLRQAQDKLRARAEEEARSAEEKKAARAAKRAGAGKANSQKSTTAAATAQARREEEAEQASQSIREVYRKLASALHPDREPNAAERQRKTGLMQRVNDAYAAKDLLTLLGVQLEIEQIDAEHLASVSPQRLAHFTQVLRDQLRELESEIAHCVMPFQLTLHTRGLTPALVDQHLSDDLRELQATIASLQDDIVAFRDPARLRASLKHYRLETEDDDDIDDVVDDDMIDFLDMLQTFAPPSARPRSSPPSARPRSSPPSARPKSSAPLKPRRPRR